MTEDTNPINEEIGTVTEEAPAETQEPAQEEVPEQGMVEEKSGLVDAKGEEVKKISIPVIKYKDFVFPITTVTPEYQNYIGPDGQVRPLDIIKELRMALDEMRNKFTVLSVGLAIAAKSNPEVDEYLTTIGLVLEDLNKKRFYPAE